MSDTFKKLIASIITITAVGMAYFGAYLPLKKAQAYVDAMRSYASVNSVEDFNNLFANVFNLYSPVGQDEVTSSYIGFMMSLIGQQPDGRVVDALLGQLDQNTKPLFEAGKGFGYSQSLYGMGLLYGAESKRFNNQDYYQKAIGFFQKGLNYSPKRPGFLYGLFDLYREHNDNVRAKEIGVTILKYWPQDQEVSKFVSGN